MVSNASFIDVASSFPGVVQLPHFEKLSFRVKKKIFTTLSEEKRIAMVVLSLIDQSVFCAFNKEIIYPVPGKWGMQGCTYIELTKLPKAMLKDLLASAFKNVVKKSTTQGKS